MVLVLGLRLLVGGRVFGEGRGEGGLAGGFVHALHWGWERGRAVIKIKTE